jgi:hypothetical protein
MNTTLINQRAVVSTRSDATVDRYNNAVATYTDGPPTTCYIELQTAKEITIDRETYVSDWRVWLPPGTVVSGRDLIVTTDATFEIVGNPENVWNPRTRTASHVVADVRRVD